MRKLCLNVYHRLPPSGRDVIATLRGYQLRRWRYGRDTERLVEEALERETWSAAQWSEWQQERLHHLLRRAVTKVPFYREHGPMAEKQKLGKQKAEMGWGQETADSGQRTTDSGTQGPRDLGTKAKTKQKAESRDKENGEVSGQWSVVSSLLRGWPVLKKESVRTLPRDFLADDCNSGRMWCEHTSGSTGTPLTLWQSQETVRSWYALVEARWRRWYGVSRDDRWAIIGGQMVTPVSQSKPPYWVWNGGLNQLYLSAYHLSRGSAKDYIRTLRDHGITYLLGYASGLATLARLALDQDLPIPQLKAVVSNAEPLLAHQRVVIRQAFRCPEYDTYGMSEMVCAASQCEHGTMHLWPETGVWEVLDDDSDERVAPGETGRLISTGLLNSDMPLIRYNVGDRVALAPAGTNCLCGRTLPALQSVEGRNDDMVLTPDGRRIGRLDPVFKSGFPIAEAQIIQDAPDHLRVRVVPADGFGRASEMAILEALHATVGPMRATVEKVRSIPRGANGKLKAVVCQLTPAERDEIASGSASARPAPEYVEAE